MNDNQVIEMLNLKLKDNDMWYTTKNDPTWEEAPHYYELDEYGDLTDNSKKQIIKEVESYIGDGAVGVEDAIDRFIEEALSTNKIAYTSYLVTKFKDKPVVDNIGAYENPVQLGRITESEDCKISEKTKNESFKRRIQEENNKSSNLISQMFQDENFDADSNQGKIVVKTSQLFNALSDKGYDVQVSFDNGDSQSAILLGQQGGKILITITDANQPLRAFINGNLEITDENLNTLEDVKTIINQVK